MSALRIWLVRPHPPRAVLAGRQPLPEEPRYNWEPLGLKLFAYRLAQRLGSEVETTIWHLFGTADDEALIAACGREQPQVVAFSEIDLLVNQASRLAWRVKRRAPRCVTVVGGKQTSLLAPGDRSPFVAVDYAIAGDGVEPLEALCASLSAGVRPASLPGLVHVDDRRIVTRVEPLGRRDELGAIDGVALHERAVRNHELAEYLEREQRFPTGVAAPLRMASVLTATGCPHACSFCQSPVEYRNDSAAVMRRAPDSVADEIEWLVRRHGVESVFALSPNLDLDHLSSIYLELERRGVEELPITGFVRAADIVAAERRGVLAALASAGLRVLSVGLDVAYGGADDALGKQFDLATVDRAVQACTVCGVAVAATVIAAPELPAAELRASLEPLCRFPLQSVDVRLATAFRNTAYFRGRERYLVRHPDRSSAYFDHQSYRYQTLLVPGGARPRETYRVVREFVAGFARHPVRAAAVRDLTAAHPGLRPWFGDDEVSGEWPEAAYDALADLYDCTFGDIRVRRAEWRWLERKVPRDGQLAVLDVGCGAGALLNALSARIGRGVGLDVSEQMLAHARERNDGDDKLGFARGDATHAPFADGSFDVVVSFLSLHYLAWPAAVDEAMRLLVPGGRFLCVDMVSSPVRRRELHRLAAGRTAVTAQHVLHPRFAARLRALVRRPDWQEMERRYPLRPLKEYAELAVSLGARLDVLSVGVAAKVVAFEAVKRDQAASPRRDGAYP